MITHTDWSTETFNLPAVAPLVGPFAGRDWLHTWWQHRRRGDLVIAATADSLLPLVSEGDTLTFAGEADLTDYHSPLGSSDALSKLVGDLPIGTNISLDSLPEEAAASVTDALTRAGLSASMREHAVTAVLELPPSFDEYLAGIGKKDRHELRRKRRRFDAEVGTGSIERRSGPEAIDLFASLHRRSAGDKGTFMSDPMAEFFLGLHTHAGAVVDVLVDGEGNPASTIISFEDDEGFYLYNSAFEPDLRHLSPGNVVLSHLIERSIGQGKKVFDFLKGDETYKFRLGAKPRSLYEVTASVGGQS